jgi:phosphoenolpyruvate carboxykinase (ATP)
MTIGRGNPAFPPDEPGITGIGPVHCNLTEPAMIKAALRRHEGRLGKGGAVLVPTGSHTGRFPKDKPVVRTASVENSIWWGNTASQTPDAFDRLYTDMIAYLQGRDAFVQDLYAGADPAHRLDVRVVTELAGQGLFIPAPKLKSAQCCSSS